MTKSDKINLGMAIFTGGLFFVTGYSTYLTRQAIISSDSTNNQYLGKMKQFAEASKQSANAADSAVKEQRINDSVIRRNDSIKFDNDTAYAIKKIKADNIINNRN